MFSNKETKEEKQARKQEEMLAKYGLQGMFDDENIRSVRNICADLAGSGLMYWGAALSNDEKTMIRVMVNYQKAIFEQNLIIIRELDRIAQIAKEASDNL